jgi:hypothetical protein
MATIMREKNKQVEADHLELHPQFVIHIFKVRAARIEQFDKMLNGFLGCA